MTSSSHLSFTSLMLPSSFWHAPVCLYFFQVGKVNKQNWTGSYCLGGVVFCGWFGLVWFFFKKCPLKHCGHSSVTNTEASSVTWNVLQIFPAKRHCSARVHASHGCIFSSPTQMSQLSKAAKMTPCSDNSMSLYTSACRAGHTRTHTHPTRYKLTSV